MCDQLWGTSLNPINSVLPWLHRRLQTLSAVIMPSSLHLNTHIHAHTQANHNHRVQEDSLFRPFEKEKHTKSPVKQQKQRERNEARFQDKSWRGLFTYFMWIFQGYKYFRQNCFIKCSYPISTLRNPSRFSLIKFVFPQGEVKILTFS